MLSPLCLQKTYLLTVPQFRFNCFYIQDLFSLLAQTLQSHYQQASGAKSASVGPRLHVNLEKLETGTLSGLNDDSVAIDTVMAENEGYRLYMEERAQRQNMKKEEEVNFSLFLIKLNI